MPPHGARLVLDGPGLVVVQASANAAELLGMAGPLPGQPVAHIPGDLAARIRPHLHDPLAHAMPLASRCAVGLAGNLFDVTLHRPPPGGLVVELEPAAIPVNRARQMVDAVGRILDASTLPLLCDVAARIVRDATGHDHVAVCRLGADGRDEVLAEAGPRATMPGVVMPGAVMAGAVMPGAVMPGAVMAVPLTVGGRPWGTIACRHARPRAVPFHVRVVCELLAEAVATRIAALESVRRGQAELAVQRLEQGLRDAIRRDGDWRGVLFGDGQRLLEPLRATGAALLMDGQVMMVGRTPERSDVQRIGAWLDDRAATAVFATASLGRDDPGFATLPALAGGLAAIRLSPVPGDYLLWFRPESPCAQAAWGGDAARPDATPVHPFTRLQAGRRQDQAPWTEADLAAARLIGETIKDIALQFRSVSLVIAHQQLERTRRQVGGADAPLLVAGADGCVLLASAALRAAIGGARPPGRLGDLPDLFADADDCRRRLKDLCDHGLPWRGRVRLRTDGRPLLVRADPVLSSPGQVSGFVLLLSDITEQETAEAAQLSFQDSVLALERLDAPGGRERRSGPAMQDVLATVIENARLAALEIADGVDVAGMPEMLRSVSASVARARRAIDHLSGGGDDTHVPSALTPSALASTVQAGAVH